MSVDDLVYCLVGLDAILDTDHSPLGLVFFPIPMTPLLLLSPLLLLLLLLLLLPPRSTHQVGMAALSLEDSQGNLMTYGWVSKGKTMNSGF